MMTLTDNPTKYTVSIKKGNKTLELTYAEFASLFGQAKRMWADTFIKPAILNSKKES